MLDTSKLVKFFEGTDTHQHKAKLHIRARVEIINYIVLTMIILIFFDWRDYKFHLLRKIL